MSREEILFLSQDNSVKLVLFETSREERLLKEQPSDVSFVFIETSRVESLLPAQISFSKLILFERSRLVRLLSQQSNMRRLVKYSMPFKELIEYKPKSPRKSVLIFSTAKISVADKIPSRFVSKFSLTQFLKPASGKLVSLIATSPGAVVKTTVSSCSSMLASVGVAVCVASFSASAVAFVTEASEGSVAFTLSGADETVSKAAKANDSNFFLIVN